MQRINWREWNDEAFEEARQSGKPVLLAITAVWCHWCHVMDETTYSNPTVADLINQRFIPIRVDNDRNPDLNARFNMGGWPTTAFLTHERDVITGATYIPPDQMAGILQRVAAAYSAQTDYLVRAAGESSADTGRRMAEVEPRQVGLSDAEAVLRAVRAAYDPEYGGFGRDQKFPFSDALELLLYNHERTGSEQDLAMVVNTLESMIRGEVFDKVEGGMFRYATRRDWTAPHYEKMLEDNARIAYVLLEAYRATGRDDFLQTARGIFSYAEKTLLDPDTGAFRGSQDADERYYSVDLHERGSMQPPRVDNAVYADSNALMAIACLRLWSIAREGPARETARGIVTYFSGLPRADDGTVCHYVENGQPRQFGNLADQAALLLANTACFEATADDTFIHSATALAGPLASEFASKIGGLYDITLSRAEERGLSRQVMPLGDNATAARGLMKLAELTGDAAHRETASRVLQALGDQYSEHGIMAADYALTVALLSTDAVVVTVTTPVDDPARDSLIRASMAVCNAACTVKPMVTAEEGLRGATVCVGSRCLAHTEDPDELAEEIETVVRSGSIGGS